MSDNPFVGTWEDSYGTRYVFTETNVTQSNYTNQVIYWSGIYIYNDESITITTNYRGTDFEDLEMYPEPFIFSYKFENNALSIGLAYVQKVTN